MQRFLTASAIWLASIVLAAGISYAGVSWVLGFQVSGAEFDRFADVQKLRPAVREVLAFERGGHLRSEDIQRFATAVGIPAETLLSAAARHPATLPLEAVIRANPYPQPLPTSDYPYWLSLTYRATDTGFHQITWYGGESDSTPSLLVRKVPSHVGWGDYFVRYTVQLSRATMKESPYVDSLRWHAYRGGSYDGFEELGFTLLGTLVLTPIVRYAIARLTSRRQIRVAPTSGSATPASSNPFALRRQLSQRPQGAPDGNGS
jgi:hypothetical protein